MKFNADQQACIECDENLLIVAPPGSGKTGTIVAKAARILRDPDARVGMVTFTRAAADEMMHRMRVAAGKEVPRRRLLVNTFHSHAIQQLKISNRYGRQVSPHQQGELIVQAMDVAGYTLTYKDAREEIEAAKRKLGFSGEESDLIAAYQQSLRSLRALDMTDLCRLAVIGMLDGSVKPLDVTHLLADEFQDADELQLEWVVCHASRAVLTCVGDDDQAIYGWRGSMGYGGMEQFKQRTGAQHINLQVNYRSRLELIQASQAVIVHNSERIEKTVLCARGQGGSVRVINTGPVADEADTVADLIMEDLKASGRDRQGLLVSPKGRWAVIARTNFALRAVAIALRANEIVYSCVEEREELDGSFQTLLLTLNALQTASPLTIDAALRGLGFSGRNLADLHASLGDRFADLLEGELPETLGGFAREDERRLRTLCECFFPVWRQKVRDGFYQLVVDDVANFIESSGILGNDDAGEFRDNVKRLKGRRGSLVAITRPFLEPRKPEHPGDGVGLYTMHGCKGLEFDNVALIRCNEGTMPNPKSVETGHDEERRLFYVAMTRARLNLAVLWASGAGRISSFVEHIPRELLSKGCTERGVPA